ncbi:hypothetical protein, partial [Streptomyces sp. UNOC14_S4]|uniref:hypothetical protein n=1 Tax=Streptomyces sp. UNOC14_S4 TaxID=2872340 RepID=UPI001E3C6532
MPDPVTVEIEPFHGGRGAAASLAGDLTGLPAVREHLTGPRLGVADFQVLEKEPSPGSPFRALVHDPDAYRSLEVTGRLDDLAGARARFVRFRPVPGAEEFARAVEALRGHGTFGSVLASGRVTAYRPMPPLADVTNPDGTVDRVVTVGLHDPEGIVRHRIVGVRMRDHAVIPDPEGVPAPSALD